MVKNRVKTKEGKTYEYDYPDKTQIRYFIDKKIFQDFDKVCDAHNFDKTKLIEAFFKTLNLRFRDNSINPVNPYITINIGDAKKS